MRDRLVTVIAIAGLSALATNGAEVTARLYNVASLVSDGSGSNSRLVIFPFDGKEFSISLPLALGSVVYGPSGRSLYATAFRQPGLLKIEFNPVRVGVVPGSETLSPVPHFGVSRDEDRILFAAIRSEGGRKTCGVFEMRLSDGNVHAVIPDPECSTTSAWRIIDLSPSGNEALIKVGNGLELLDLAHATTKPLSSEFWGAAWSPDGKWIAALKFGSPGRKRTVLIDPSDFSRTRDLGGSNDDEVKWSPDSRFILHYVYRPSCPSTNALALETVDVQTGVRSIIRSSICNVDRMSGWVSRDIRR